MQIYCNVPRNFHVNEFSMVFSLALTFNWNCDVNECSWGKHSNRTSNGNTINIYIYCSSFEIIDEMP